MKQFLTSNGLCNDTLKQEFIKLVGKKPEEIKIAFVPTAANIIDEEKDWLIDDMYNIKSIGAEIDIVDISALPKEIWLPRLEKADVLFFGGGDSEHLLNWVKKTGLDKMLPELLKTRVYAGISAGSMITCPNLFLNDKDSQIYYEGKTFKSNDQALNYNEFYFRPHYNSGYFSRANYDNLKELSANFKETIYAIDDNSAIIVDGDQVKVVSEGDKWEIFND